MNEVYLNFNFNSVIRFIVFLVIIQLGTACTFANTYELDLPGNQIQLKETLVSTPVLPTSSPTQTNTSIPSPTSTSTITPTPTPTLHPMTILAMRQTPYPGSEIVIENTLTAAYNYNRYYAYYLSEGYKIYGLLTVPTGDPPEGGWPSIVFNHGNPNSITWTI